MTKGIERRTPNAFSMVAIKAESILPRETQTTERTREMEAKSREEEAFSENEKA